MGEDHDRRTVAHAIRQAAERLSASSGTARLDAELLMAEALGTTRSDMLLTGGSAPPPAGFDALVERRMAREPVAYILGRQEFYGREFIVTPDTLIPRGDSEVLIEAASELAPAPCRTLDLGTGTGALLLTRLAECGGEGIGTDASEAALNVARRNADALDLSDRAEFCKADWTGDDLVEGLGRFDLILCNPPYVETTAELDPDVRDYEPHAALFAGEDGMDDYRCLVPQVADLMNANGIAIFEIGHEQAEPVMELAVDHGFRTRLFRDLADRPRAIALFR